MADLSKVKLNGTAYNLKDSWARENLQTASDVNTAITEALGDISGFSISVLAALPASGEAGVFYFIPNSGSGNNIYDEYVWVNNTFEKIGSTEVDLSNYLQKTHTNNTVIGHAEWVAGDQYNEDSLQVNLMTQNAGGGSSSASGLFLGSSGTLSLYSQSEGSEGVGLSLEMDGENTYYTADNNAVIAFPSPQSSGNYTLALTSDIPTNVSAFTNDAGYLTSFTETDPTVPAWAKASTKPTYTASEVGAAASSHAHGSITNAGAITGNTALANGDRLVFSDNSDSSLLKRSSITIGTSTTQYLANNGTWQNLPTVSVTQSLTSGTKIGEVNSTSLYAPSPYDDTALAARVTALENLEWATYYSGRSNPSDAQGTNGDIYLQY